MLKLFVLSPPRATRSLHLLHSANFVSFATEKKFHTGEHHAGSRFHIAFLMCGCGLTGVTEEVDDEVIVGESCIL